MKSILVILLSLMTLPAFGGDCKSADIQSTEVRFNYSSFRSYYHCDFVEHQSQRILEELGAIDIDVRCRGGLPYDRNLTVTANFSRNIGSIDGREEACEEDVRFRFRNDSCDLHEKMIDSFLEGFEATSEKNSTCYDSSGRIEYDISVLK